jgi:hypothetical protein
MPKSISFWNHPINKIEEALSIRKQIAALQAKLSGMFGAANEDEPAVKGKRGGKRTMSAATIAKMRAAQQARWAKKRGTTVTSAEIAAPAEPTKKGKRTMSAEARERIAAAQRARWAKSRGETTSAAAAPATAKPAKAKKRKITQEGRAKMAAAARKRWAAQKAGK